MTESSIQTLRISLLDWYATTHRDLPWRRTRDPYAIWISETMLQQTRVAAVIPFFARFLTRFPDVASLANASESDLLAHWAGLGYYYRARNVQKAARQIVANGEFPRAYDAIAALPGVGPYTAAAVASIAFDLPHAVLDGNVYRVLSRLFNDSTNIAASTARKHFAAFAGSLLDRAHPGQFNQAMMELGATVCLPKKPQCLLCPIADNCAARQAGTTGMLPIKIKPRKSVDSERRLLWITRDDEVLAWQRAPESRLMPGFWELPESIQVPTAVPQQKLGAFRHGITVHNFRFDVWTATLPPGQESATECVWLPRERLTDIPLSTIFRKTLSVVERQAQRASAAATA